MEILKQFGIDPILLAAQVVNFLILLFILKKLLYKPLLGVLETRKNKIEESLKNAEEIEKRLNETGEREQEAILKSAKEGEKIIKEAGDSAAQIIEEAKKKYKDIVTRAAEDAKKLNEAEKVKLQQEIKDSVADFVVLALERITGKVLTQSQKKEILAKNINNYK
ncbi:F0F1 ATP synthase subunit B [Candidatus Daviesbacteria bacterium]|nr:F0F1 ATP synthase subunit B [Candidatus Daviesbacteria bacterium]